MLVYYLSPAPFAISNIALRRLKISRFADLNDPFELLAAEHSDVAQARHFERAKEALNQSTGLICFSASWSNPVLWGHYADKHTGIALGFEIPDSHLTPVTYAQGRTQQKLSVDAGKPTIEDPLIRKLASTKFSDWRYEEELRLFVTLDPWSIESGLYFHSFNDDLRLVQVILGPRCGMKPVVLTDLLATYSQPIKVVKSRLASREFKVIEDRLRLGKGMGGRVAPH